MSNKAEGALMRSPKKLVVCCDGTWKDSENGWVNGTAGHPGNPQNPTNVTRIVRAIQAEDSAQHPQIVYYQAGVGTGIGWWNHIVGGGTGFGLEECIREAYTFLANNYAPGDSIFLIGFSRGAYTARSIGGLIAQLGLLKKKALQHFYSIFRDWEYAGGSHKPIFWQTFSDPATGKAPVIKTPSDTFEIIPTYLEEYRAALLSYGFTRSVQIKSIGVWDTVGALGIPVNPWLQRTFHLPSFFHDYKWFDTKLDNHVDYAFQALALDEHRAPFSPAVWEKPEGCTTTLKQVWFPGAHSNVGGSYDDTASADITLAWMMDKLSGEDLLADETTSSDWDIADWIEFEPSYITAQFEAYKEWCEKQHNSIPRDWSKGTIYNSSTFPQSLLGKKVRTPGRNNPTIYQTGVLDTSRLLYDTHEYIHASVRTRIDLGSHDLVAKQGTQGLWNHMKTLWDKHFGGQPHGLYQPQKDGALVDWTLRDGHELHNHPNGIDAEDAQGPWWEYRGRDHLVVKNKQLQEESMGSHELELLGKFGDVADHIAESNRGLKSVRELEGLIREARAIKAHTF